MNRHERAEHLEGTITRAVADLEAQMQAGQTENFVKSLEWWSKFRHYSYNNTLLIAVQRPDAIQVAGYKRWEALGYQVKKGEKCIYIRGPVFKKLPDETGELVERLVSYIPLCVFDISQTKEWPDKQPPNPYRPESTADWEALYAGWRRRLTTLYGVRVKELQMGALAYGAATKNTILVNSIHDVSIRAMNLIHETCHIAAGHTSEEGQKRWTRQERETQVQAATFVLCQMLGASHPNAANYLLQYQVEPGQLAGHLEMISTIVRDVRHLLAFDELEKPDRKAA